MPSLRIIKRTNSFYHTTRMFRVRFYYRVILNFDDPNYIQTLSCLFQFVFYNFHAFLTIFFDSKIFLYISRTHVHVFLMNKAVM